MKNEFSTRGMNLIVWPSCYPDLNPIESICDMMKSHITEYHPGLVTGSPSKNEICNSVLEARESIEAE